MFYLAPHVFLTPVRDKAVILDVLRDKYVALNSEMTKAVFQLLGSSPKEMASELLSAQQALVEQGILTDRPPTSRRKSKSIEALARPSETRWPSTRADLQTQREPGLSATGAVMAALGQVAIALRTQPFHKLVDGVARQPVRAANAKTEQEALDDYFRARPWFPIKPICRLDAPALCLYLRRCGHPADLVFGVTLERFSAHCWVQIGDRILNEPYETIVGYSPIMVV
jgi:hypothetical protein